MPRTDPISGCQVMTFPEFLQAEADREGKEPGDIMQEIVQTFDDDNEIMRKNFRDHGNALSILQMDADELCQQWKEDRDRAADQGDFFSDPLPARPVEIIAVLTAEHHQGFGGSSGGFTARVKCDDSKECYAVYGFFSDNGDRMNPPDGGSEIDYYTDPDLTPDERALLATVGNTHIHRDRWWRDYPKDVRKGLEDNGCISRAAVR